VLPGRWLAGPGSGAGAGIGISPPLGDAVIDWSVTTVSAGTDKTTTPSAHHGEKLEKTFAKFSEPDAHGGTQSRRGGASSGLSEDGKGAGGLT
jgi:hypothetical protein